MIIEILLNLLTVYVICGFVFSIAFLIAGINKIDEAARGSTIGFKMIIIPGVIIFWPYLLRKWIMATKEKIQ